MKPFIEKLPLSENNSFVAQTHATPNFEVLWHQHIEYELILIKQGEGQSFIGNFIGDFKPGDIFFLGSNLPHTFQKANPALFTSALVVHFQDNFWGNQFLGMPECRQIQQLLHTSAKGLKMEESIKTQLSELMQLLEMAAGFKRMVILCQCLELMSSSIAYETLSTQEINRLSPRSKERIDNIFQYTIANFQGSICLQAIAGNVGMSVPAFCNYFKKSTKKTYIDFLNEVRIGHACKQLMDTQMSIEQVCYDCGFSTPANFNKQFLKIKKTTPSQFRKVFLERKNSNYALI